MAAWNKMKKLIVAHADSTDEMDSIKEEEKICETPSPLPKNTKTEICRTPMGEYIVPEGKKPLTSLCYSYPGPADYLPKVALTKSAAAQYSVVGKPKIIDGKRNIPGPFEYNCSGDTVWKNKTISLKGRAKTNTDMEAERSIGVLGKYRVEYKGVGSEGPKYTMGSKHFPLSWPIYQGDNQGYQTPGPNYRPNSGYWGRGLKKSFGRRLEGQVKSKEAPGPADYDVKQESRGPSYSFGIKLPEPVSALQKVSRGNPAANTYDLGTTIGKAPATSISGREREPSASKLGPCPTAYYPVQKLYNKYKAATMAYRWFEINEPNPKPGPADYSIKYPNLKNSPQYSCRRRPKSFARAETEGPGPGAYQTAQSSEKNDRPAFSFRQRLKDLSTAEKENIPGPNVYHIENREKPESKRAPAYSMAKRLQKPNSMKETPSPAEYSPKLKSSAPKFSMTDRHKQEKLKIVNPSPNIYTLPETIASKDKGVVFKSRASPYIYSGYRTTKLEEPRNLPEINV